MLTKVDVIQFHRDTAECWREGETAMTDPIEVSLCLLCGKLVPNTEADAHCAEHERAKQEAQGEIAQTVRL